MSWINYLIFLWHDSGATILKIFNIYNLQLIQYECRTSIFNGMQMFNNALFHKNFKFPIDFDRGSKYIFLTPHWLKFRLNFQENLNVNISYTVISTKIRILKESK